MDGSRLLEAQSCDGLHGHNRRLQTTTTATKLRPGPFSAKKQHKNTSTRANQLQGQEQISGTLPIKWQGKVEEGHPSLRARSQSLCRKRSRMVQTRYITTKLLNRDWIPDTYGDTHHPPAGNLSPENNKGGSECLCQTAFWSIWSSLSLWEWSGKRHHQGESIVLMEHFDAHMDNNRETFEKLLLVYLVPEHLRLNQTRRCMVGHLGKEEAELSARHHLVVRWIRWWGRLLPITPKRIMRDGNIWLRLLSKRSSGRGCSMSRLLVPVVAAT